MSKFQNDSIFWIEVEKIKPNPYQPRKEFSEDKLKLLADSIRQYGVLQPLVVTRYEIQKPDGGLMAEYELIAGERRLRASKLAGLSQVPVIIREGDQDEGAKLELAIIENLQREDLNPIDRALAFHRLTEEFGFKHNEVAKKVGKSREYVSNSLRLLTLPDEMQKAISAGQITEGHARPILMLKDRPEEQDTLFKEIVFKKLTVRDAEAIARKIAHDKIRKRYLPPDPEMVELEGQLSESLGTRVQIERREVGGKLTIDFFSNEDLRKILELVHSNEKKNPYEMLDNYIKTNGIVETVPEGNDLDVVAENVVAENIATEEEAMIPTQEEKTMIEETDWDKDDVMAESVPDQQPKEDESDLYSIKDFTI
ncbi:TPA: stage 0 sporulation protein J [Candidatus Campbellbacteria bacterium]|nr:MAG: chromosome partitioning protein ParB, chromosome partitioning protein, ParB family [Candidatus Campbellbacteria bacterium GW2011_OD1_34_28]KKP74852.1 MAG: ParB-like protein partition protein [Candidatus Campbellbacteria bacterium GW2011_GWD2_35_24]KKP75738.1 MAG: chromosome partitioning protein ParB, chromosome partitioning protein, ParB family [Candidatus Campbellbacteria bacterium GW2011_GWC2_35_28]KKP77014.1 MAG: ParB-like protein partition protein [Candidatus Campbellbacteria bacteri